MNKCSLACLVIALFGACQKASTDREKPNNVLADSLAQNVVDETLRSWKAYKQYAWGHDGLMPLSKSYEDWYDEPLLRRQLLLTHLCNV